jgi:hypothetical protein
MQQGQQLSILHAMNSTIPAMQDNVKKAQATSLHVGRTNGHKVTN